METLEPSIFASMSNIVSGMDNIFVEVVRVVRIPSMKYMMILKSQGPPHL